MISPWVAAGWCLAAYLIGGLPVGWLLVRRKRYGLDLRNFGTGNIGTSNVYRHAGIDIAIIVGPLQFVQGFAPVIASRLLGLPLSASMLIAVCAVAGNGWPIYMKFNGGRGVAVATGAVAALSIAGLIALLMCYAWGAIRGRIALAVLVGFVVLPPVAFLFGGSEGWILGGRAAWRSWRCSSSAASKGCLATSACTATSRRRVFQRLVFDERPGRPLMGPRTDHNVELAAPLTQRGSARGTSLSALVDLPERVPPLSTRIAFSSPVAMRCVTTASGIAGRHEHPVDAPPAGTSVLLPEALDREHRHLGHPSQPGGGGAERDLAATEVDDHRVTTGSGMSLRIAANRLWRTARMSPRAAFDDTSTSRSVFRLAHAAIRVTRSGPTGAITAVTRSPEANPHDAATSQLPKWASAKLPRRAPRSRRGRARDRRRGSGDASRRPAPRTARRSRLRVRA